jgi:hypothetical protein
MGKSKKVASMVLKKKQEQAPKIDEADLVLAGETLPTSLPIIPIRPRPFFPRTPYFPRGGRGESASRRCGRENPQGSEGGRGNRSHPDQLPGALCYQGTSRDFNGTLRTG